MKQSGLMDLIILRHDKMMKKNCNIEEQKISSSFQKLIFPFTVLLSGFAIALFLILVEYFVNKAF